MIGDIHDLRSGVWTIIEIRIAIAIERNGGLLSMLHLLPRVVAKADDGRHSR